MIWLLTYLPAALALLLGVVMGVAPLPLHPAWSARLLAVIAVTTAVAVIGTLVFVGVNYVATLLPGLADRYVPEWALFGDDQPVHAALGVPALALTGLSLVVMGRLAARWAAEVRAAQRTARRIVESGVPMALAVPGRDGGVLVSRGLLRTLDRTELRVVFEHEAAHLRHRHHRYLAAGALAAGTVPVLRRLNARLRFALERWADEDAAEAVGDRTLVAHTIARVALARAEAESARPPEPSLPAFTESGVVQRVQALLSAPPSKNRVTGPVLLAGVGAATGLLASAAWQLDHAFGLNIL